MSSLFALLSAAFFAGNALCVRLGLRGSTATTATIISVVTNITALWVFSAASGVLAAITVRAALLFLVAGMFAPALARLTYYESINLIGVARASTISNTTPIFAAILAVPVLGEQLTWRLAAGTVLVVVGVGLTVRPQDRGQTSRPWAGILLALNTAVMASISFLLRKIGLGMLPHPVVASALTVTGSLITLVPYVVLRRRREPLRADRGSLTYLIAGGLLTTGGFLSYFAALNLGDVVRVTPLSNTTPLLALGLLYLFRQIETVAPATVAGAVLAVAGVLLVVSG